MSQQSLKFKLSSVSPLLMHNGRLADPMNEFARRMKEISSKRSKTDADFIEMARIEWYGGMYLMDGALILGLKCALVTNGQRLGEGWGSVLPRFSWIRVSLDAGQAETYAKVRSVKPDHFKRALDHIYALHCAVNGRSATTLGVGFVVTAENWREVGEAVRLAKLSGAHNVRIGAMFSTEGAAYYERFWHEAKALVEQARAEHETPDFSVFDLFGRRIEDLEQGAPGYEFCAYEHYVTYIGGDQNVYRCCNQAYNAHGLLGSIADVRFRDFWFGEQRRSRVETFDARTCERCQFNTQNRIVGGMLKAPTHPEFV